MAQIITDKHSLAVKLEARTFLSLLISAFVSNGTSESDVGSAQEKNSLKRKLLSVFLERHVKKKNKLVILLLFGPPLKLSRIRHPFL